MGFLLPCYSLRGPLWGTFRGAFCVAPQRGGRESASRLSSAVTHSSPHRPAIGAALTEGHRRAAQMAGTYFPQSWKLESKVTVPMGSPPMTSSQPPSLPKATSYAIMVGVRGLAYELAGWGWGRHKHSVHPTPLRSSSPPFLLLHSASQGHPPTHKPPTPTSRFQDLLERFISLR